MSELVTHAEEFLIDRFLKQDSKNIIKIPVYQRGYDWGPKHVRDLWNDLLKTDKSVDTHFFGF